MSKASAESEYKSMAQGVCKLLWLQSLLCEQRILDETGLTLDCDYKATISIADTPV